MEISKCVEESGCSPGQFATTNLFRFHAELVNNDLLDTLFNRDGFLAFLDFVLGRLGDVSASGDATREAVGYRWSTECRTAAKVAAENRCGHCSQGPGAMLCCAADGCSAEDCSGHDDGCFGVEMEVQKSFEDNG